MIWGSKKVLSSSLGQVGFLAGPYKSSSNKNGDEQEVKAVWTRWNLSSYRWLIYRETDLKIHFCVLHASFVSFKLFLSFWNRAKKKEERNQCYSQEEEDLYYITPKYKQVLPSTLVPTDNSKLQP